MVGKNEKPVEVKPTTIAKVRAAKNITKSVTKYTKQQISNAIDFGLELGKQAKDEFVSTEKGKNVTENKYFIHAANVGKGAFDLFVGMYSGLENAFTSVASGTRGLSESVLEHKYGTGVKQVFSEGSDTLFEVYQMQGMLKREALKKTGHVIKDELYSTSKVDAQQNKSFNPFDNQQGNNASNLQYAPKSVMVPGQQQASYGNTWNMNSGPVKK